MQKIICQAIEERKLLRLVYDGHERIVEPHLVGQKRTGNDALSAWQVGGYSKTNRQPPWRNYLLHRISHAEIIDQTFEQARPGYNPNDKTMSHIYCRL